MILLGAAVAIRGVLMIAYFPALMLSFDSPRYARVTPTTLFGDFWMPAGYPMFLRLLHLISRQLWFTVAVQHGLGVCVGALVFFALCRTGISGVWSCAAAAVPLFSGDCLYLEHQIMTDSFFLFVMTAGLTTAIFADAERVKKRWLIGSALLCFAGLVRSIGIVLPMLLAAVMILFRRNTKSLAYVFIGAGTTLGLYIVMFILAHGQYLGLSDMGGWNLYARVAPFADCRQFSPPAGTEILCEDRPAADRPGPFGYVWDVGSTPRRNFALGPESEKLLERFALEAMLHQPADYIRAVATDFARFFAPHFAARAYSGQPAEILSFRWRDMAVEQRVVSAIKRRYRGVQVSVHGTEILGTYQDAIRLHGPLIALLFVGAAFATSPQTDRSDLSSYFAAQPHSHCTSSRL